MTTGRESLPASPSLGTLDYPLMSVLDDAIDAVLAATGGALAIPAGGAIRAQTMTKAGSYRLTFDVVVKPPEKRVAPEAWGPRRILAFEKVKAS